jgi:hypothetical protein
MTICQLSMHHLHNCSIVMHPADEPMSSRWSRADSDGDGTSDCEDGCPGDASKVDPGLCGCGVPDDDADGDGTPDCIDMCPNAE